MPAYDYVCTAEACQATWTADQRITEPALEECPTCRAKTAKRLISGAPGFRLVGSGWFRSGGY